MYGTQDDVQGDETAIPETRVTIRARTTEKMSKVSFIC